MLLALTAQVNADWTGTMKAYSDASCTVVDSTKTWEVQRQQGKFDCIMQEGDNSPPVIYKQSPGMNGACEGGSAVSERTAGCTDTTCSTCTGSTEKETKTSAQIDEEKEMWSGKCIKHKAPNTWVVQTVESGVYPANPCNVAIIPSPTPIPTALASTPSHSAPSLTALAALLSIVVALQQRE